MPFSNWWTGENDHGKHFKIHLLWNHVTRLEFDLATLDLQSDKLPTVLFSQERLGGILFLCMFQWHQGTWQHYISLAARIFRISERILSNLQGFTAEIRFRADLFWCSWHFLMLAQAGGHLFSLIISLRYLFVGGVEYEKVLEESNQYTSWATLVE